MNSWGVIGKFFLIVVLYLARMAFALDADITESVPGVEEQMPSGQTGKKTGMEKKSGLAEMREWLNQRNMNRKEKGSGLPANFNTSKIVSAAPKPSLSRRQERLSARFLPGSDTPRLSERFLEPQIGRGPDGRIRHRLIINEDGPDQLQVYSNSGYAVPNATREDAGKLARLTHRGKQAWMTGSYLHAPASYYSLKPKGWNHPQSGDR